VLGFDQVKVTHVALEIMKEKGEGRREKGEGCKNCRTEEKGEEGKEKGEGFARTGEARIQ
jgi:hypothetical protein